MCNQNNLRNLIKDIKYEIRDILGDVWDFKDVLDEEEFITQEEVEFVEELIERLTALGKMIDTNQ